MRLPTGDGNSSGRVSYQQGYPSSWTYLLIIRPIVQLVKTYLHATHIAGVVIFVDFIVYIFLFLSFYSLYFDIYCFVILTRFVTDKLWKNLAPKNLAYIFDNNCHYPRYFLHFFLEPIFLTLIVISLYFFTLCSGAYIF